MDKGTIKLNGLQTEIRDARDARRKGISAVFQELSLIPYLTIADNVYLNRELTKMGVLMDKKSAIRKTQEHIDKYGFDMKAEEYVENIPAAQRQICEILKAISTDPKILIFDEPTSSLTEREAKLVFDVISDFRGRGAGIIYVSHRMNEIFEIADRVTVLRDGECAGTRDIGDVNMDDVVSMMVGRKVTLNDDKKERRPINYGETPLLEVRHIGNGRSIHDISFKLYKGETLGIAGLVGSGRTEIMNMLFGIDRIREGEVLIEGNRVDIPDVKGAIDKHIALLPESRHREGLVLLHSVKDNIILPVLRQFRKGFVKDKRREREFAGEMVAKLNIKTESVDKIVSQLSGGNQQKVVIAKWLASKPRIFIIDEPTIGVDVNAKFEIHRIIRQRLDENMGVIMISSEMPELLRYSDRLLIINNFRIIRELREDFRQETIMSAIMKDLREVKDENRQG
jgi:ABC-type sugar transport system ATPase subunit